jgi:hypothetical protein
VFRLLGNVQHCDRTRGINDAHQRQDASLVAKERGSDHAARAIAMLKASKMVFTAAAQSGRPRATSIKSPWTERAKELEFGSPHMAAWFQ